MNNFWKRLITGVFFLVVLVSGILYNQWTFAILFSIIDAFVLGEFYFICKHKGYQPVTYGGIFTGLISFWLSFLVAADIIAVKWLVLIIPFMIIPYVVVLFGNRRNSAKSLAMTLYGLLYIAMPFALISPLAFHPEKYQSMLVLGIFIIIWTNDTGAYCFGMLFGRHRLYERISPKKSWEGFIGGALVAVGVSLLLAHFFGDVLSRSQWVIVAVLTVVIGTLGDLVESQFKRTIGIKDSSNLLPGHGGILDRFDSIILAIPVIFTYLQLIA